MRPSVLKTRWQNDDKLWTYQIGSVLYESDLKRMNKKWVSTCASHGILLYDAIIWVLDPVLYEKIIFYLTSEALTDALNDLI